MSLCLSAYRICAMTILLFASALHGFEVQACSLKVGYTTPTTAELVDEAQLIVLAEVVGEKKNQGLMGDIIVRPTLMMKGRELPSRLSLRGMLAQQVVEDGGRKYRLGPATPSHPLLLLVSHPEDSEGACTRYTYNMGMMLLLFVTRDQQSYRVIEAPFSRSLEDVPSRNAPWVKAVENYISLAHLPKESRESAYIAKAAELRRSGAQEDIAIADELDWGRCERRGGLPSEKCPELARIYDAQSDAIGAVYEADLAKFEDITDEQAVDLKRVGLLPLVLSLSLLALIFSILHSYFKRKRS